MPQPFPSLLLPFLFLALFFSVAFTSNGYPKLKSLKFTLYQQETMNKTGFLVVKGVDTGADMSIYTMPFGSIYQFYDDLTVSRSPSSKKVGISEGVTISSSLDGLRTINNIQISLNWKNLKGTINVVGAVPNKEAGALPVVGGSGDFMFVQGYLTITPLDLTPPNFIFQNDFELYWPPYALKSNIVDILYSSS